LQPIEDGSPGVDEPPHIADKGGNVGKPNPPDDPNEGGRDVAVGVLVAEQAGQQHNDEQGEPGQPQGQSHRRLTEDSREPAGAQIDLRTGARRRRAVQEKSENEERQRHHGSRAVEVERQRQWQLVALAEAVRVHRMRAAERTGRTSGASPCEWPPFAFGLCSSTENRPVARASNAISATAPGSTFFSIS
jgi:hypothetical protein